MDEQLRRIFEQDQQDRLKFVGRPGLLAMPWILFRDWMRRRQVRGLIAAGVLRAPEDYYHAAMVFQHGDRLEDYWRAHELAKQAADLGHRPARWLAAAAYDRWLMRQGKPQKYGTQYTMIGKRYRLWEVDPATTDEERAEWGVPPIAVAEAGIATLGAVTSSQRLGNIIASLEIDELRVEVQDLRWARAQMPVPNQLRPNPHHRTMAPILTTCQWATLPAALAIALVQLVQTDKWLLRGARSTNRPASRLSTAGAGWSHLRSTLFALMSVR